MPTVPAFSGPPQQQMPDVTEANVLMAAAQLQQEQRLVGRPLDIRSPAQMGDMQKKANSWPEGTSPETRKIFDGLLKDGTINKDIYNKALRDPRQFTGNE